MPIGILVLDNFAGTREERIFNMFDHLINTPTLRFDSLVNFSLKNFQNLESVNVLDYQPIILHLKRPDLLPINSFTRIQFGSNLISHFQPGLQEDSIHIPFMHRPPKGQVIYRHLKDHLHPD